MTPETAEDFIQEAQYSLDECEPLTAIAEAMVAIAKILLNFEVGLEAVTVPAGPIDYERHNRADRC